MEIVYPSGTLGSINNVPSSDTVGLTVATSDNTDEAVVEDVADALSVITTHSTTLNRAKLSILILDLVLFVITELLSKNAFTLLLNNCTIIIYLFQRNCEKLHALFLDFAKNLTNCITHAKIKYDAR